MEDLPRHAKAGADLPDLLSYFAPFGRASFTKALARYGWWRCSVRGNTTLWIGLPANEKYHREPVARWPEGPLAVSFAEAPEQGALVKHFAQSVEAKKVLALFIGSSHDYVRKDETGYRMDAAIAALGGGRFTALQTMSLGDMELMFNGHGIYGKLGDVAHVLDVAPNLDGLSLFGHFELSRPFRHARLRTIDAIVQDIAGSEGPLSQQTLDNLLTSDLPRLERLSLDLGNMCELPEGFFAAGRFPALTSVDIDNLAEGSAQRLQAWKTARGID